MAFAIHKIYCLFYKEHALSWVEMPRHSWLRGLTRTQSCRILLGEDCLFEISGATMLC